MRLALFLFLLTVFSCAESPRITSSRPQPRVPIEASVFKQNRDSTSFDNVLLSRARTALDSDYLTEKYTGAQNQKLGRVFLKSWSWWIQTSWVFH